MSKIDWSKAPEWATHALVKLHNPNLGSVHWSCLVDREHRVSPDGLWFHPDGYRVAEERPKKLNRKEWTGSGVPPAGTVCEFQNSVGSWVAVEVTAIARKGMCLAQIGRDGESYVCQTASKFRPIRTPEQLAAEERETTVRAMLSIAGTTAIIVQKACEDLYDAGYRKFEIVEGE